jgi:cbb3-type cytochrome oxidase maturation protein
MATPSRDALKPPSTHWICTHEVSMSVVYLVLPLALVVVGAAVAAFVWSAKSGQYDDLETPAVRMLKDEGR